VFRRGGIRRPTRDILDNVGPVCEPTKVNLVLSVHIKKGIQHFLSFIFIYTYKSLSTSRIRSFAFLFISEIKFVQHEFKNNNNYRNNNNNNNGGGDKERDTEGPR